jgi:hypothetical protein
MSIKTKIATLAVAALALTGSFAAANAGPKINPVAAGLFGAAVVGTAVVAATTPSYAYGYQSYRRCGWQPRYNVFGQYIGSVKVCSVY